MKHQDLRKIHLLENWTFADAAARAALVGALPEDIGKIAFQQSDKTYWRLDLDAPLTWVQVGGGGGGGGAAAKLTRATRSFANFSLPNNTQTALPFDGVTVDDDGKWDSLNPTRLTAKEDGYHLIQGNIGFSSNATGIRQVAVRLNGSTNILFNNKNTVGVGFTTMVPVCVIYPLVIGDYIELMLLQNSGAAMTLFYLFDSTLHLSMTKL